MRVRALAIFAVIYAVVLALGLSLFRLANQIFDWTAPTQDITKNIGFILNLLAFAIAISAAMSWRLHDRLGGASGPLAFRNSLVTFRLEMTIGVAVLAMLVDTFAYAASSWLFTSRVLLPHFGRISVLALVYGGLAWMVISDCARKKMHHGRG